MKNAKSALFGYVSIGIVALVAKTHNQAKRKKSTTDLHQKSVVLFFCLAKISIFCLLEPLEVRFSLFFHMKGIYHTVMPTLHSLPWLSGLRKKRAPLIFGLI